MQIWFKRNLTLNYPSLKIILLSIFTINWNFNPSPNRFRIIGCYDEEQRVKDTSKSLISLRLFNIHTDNKITEIFYSQHVPIIVKLSVQIEILER